MGFLETAPGFSPADVQCTVKCWMNTVQEHSSLMWHEAESKKKGRISSLLTDYETTHFGVPLFPCSSHRVAGCGKVLSSPQLLQRKRGRAVEVGRCELMSLGSQHSRYLGDKF